jgi:hypothetical protein
MKGWTMMTPQAGLLFVADARFGSRLWVTFSRSALARTTTEAEGSADAQVGITDIAAR